MMGRSMLQQVNRDTCCGDATPLSTATFVTYERQHRSMPQHVICDTCCGDATPIEHRRLCHFHFIDFFTFAQTKKTNMVA